MLWFAPQLYGAALATLALAALCQVDDRRGLSVRVRFLAQGAAAAVMCAAYLPSTAWPFAPILIVALVWGINLYNFMDGADGLAGGMALIGFFSYAWAAMPWSPALAAGALAVAGAATGFLLFNWPPAKLFLGDSGSIPLGFLAGVLGLVGWTAHAWPLWFPVMVFSPFIADASVTLIKRILRRERIWEAHRSHYYQRMIQMGGSHAPTVYAWYALMFCATVLAQIMLAASRRESSLVIWLLSAVWIVLLLLLGTWVDRRWRQFSHPAS